MSWKELIKILTKHWALVKKWKWSHFKVRFNNKNSIIPVYGGKNLPIWLLKAIFNQLDIDKDVDIFKDF